MNELKIALLAGAESKEFLHNFTVQIDRLEKLLGKTKGLSAETPVKKVDEDEPEADEDDDFNTKTPAKRGKPKKAAPTTPAFDDDEDVEATDEAEEIAEAVADDDEDTDFAAPPPKKTKAKKITIDDLNEAAQALCKSVGKEGRKHVLGILKNKFKVTSLTELEPSQYQECMDALKVTQ